MAEQKQYDRPISHETLRAFFEIHKIGERTLETFSISPKNTCWTCLRFCKIIPSKLLNFIDHQAKSIDMALRAIKSPGSDYTLFLDTNVWNSHAGLLLSCFRRGTLLYLSMWDQQLASKSLFRRLSLRLFKYIITLRKAKIILFECDDVHVAPELRFSSSSKIIIPMPRSSNFEPCIRKRNQFRNGERLRLGVAGLIRPWKNNFDRDFLETILSACESFGENVEFHIGFPSWQHTPRVPDQVKYTDTTQPGQYTAFLRHLDAMLINLPSEEYWFRSSGVVQDALSAGTFVIANDYPIIRSQIMSPARVGSVYSDNASLRSAIISLPQMLNEKTAENLRVWNDFRKPAMIEEAIFQGAKAGNALGREKESTSIGA
ncbi:MAG TPA: hypothetical protein DDZ51_09205 [Planctomycetaceae bacterium]|nr:hypothetical protein [Planctomycetaceae bacterium]